MLTNLRRRAFGRASFSTTKNYDINLPSFEFLKQTQASNVDSIVAIVSLPHSSKSELTSMNKLDSHEDANPPAQITAQLKRQRHAKDLKDKKSLTFYGGTLDCSSEG